jgi:Kef-type K+ transport system membrane component KefB
VVAPFLLGAAIAPVLLASSGLGTHPDRDGPVPAVPFALFLGTAMSITAIPILGRLMMEWNVTRTRLGAITITAAAMDDATGWILLATVAAGAQTQFQPVALLQMVGATVLFAVVMIWLVRPVLCRWARSAVRPGKGELSLNRLAVLLALLLACAITTNLIGIFAIFGAFLLGAILSAEQQFRQVVTRRLGDLVTVFFLPVFFTYTGLRTRIDTLGSLELWLLCGLVLAAAVAGKFGGCTLAGWFSGLSLREAGCVGVMMNTRALMELIVINVGYDLRVIPPSVYCMLVLMALTTTVMTSPILMRLMRGTELEPFIRRSGFARRREATAPVAASPGPVVLLEEPA